MMNVGFFCPLSKDGRGTQAEFGSRNLIPVGAGLALPSWRYDLHLSKVRGCSFLLHEPGIAVILIESGSTGGIMRNHYK
jgi:hypothetical protein